jgi:flavin-dependent dehydrogenase
MQSCDVLVVGGGPAGSSCAWRLRGAGVDVLVLDKATFPRDKVCAGWITPQALDALEIDRADYCRGRVFQPITGFRVGRMEGPELRIDYETPVSFGVRRCEFDHYLLGRSHARLKLGEPVQSIRRTGGCWTVNQRYQTPLLVGAGGHFCPVAGLLGVRRHGDGPLVVAQEIEFAMSPRQQAACLIEPEIPLLRFCDDLRGYGWCFRKGDFLNVGLGRLDRHRLSEHVARFCRGLTREGLLAEDCPKNFRGHAYLVYEHSPRPLLDDGVLLIGDSAGMAYSQSGEGIRPAIESGLMAGEVILAAQGDYRRETLEAYRRMLAARFGKRCARPTTFSPIPERWRQPVGRGLLTSRWFVRRVLLERWFLHANENRS